MPLNANSIGSITKQSLQKLGIDTTVWKVHSTRGAGVAMYKSLGFTSEEVCELGKWKNVSAFTSHYLRLNATDKVGSKISQMVHIVSPLRSAESDLTWTKGIPDHGGSVWEDEAQSNGEPTLTPFALNVPDIVSSQLASDVFDSFDAQNVASSSTSQLFVPQVGSNSSCPASLVRQKPFSLKRGRQRWGSPPSKFTFAAPRQKEKQD